jgi:hypothetical protein
MANVNLKEAQIKKAKIKEEAIDLRLPFKLLVSLSFPSP